jgi:hypothetical protein
VLKTLHKPSGPGADLQTGDSIIADLRMELHPGVFRRWQQVIMEGTQDICISKTKTF